MIILSLVMHASSSKWLQSLDWKWMLTWKLSITWFLNSS